MRKLRPYLGGRAPKNRLFVLVPVLRIIYTVVNADSIYLYIFHFLQFLFFPLFLLADLWTWFWRPVVYQGCFSAGWLDSGDGDNAPGFRAASFRFLQSFYWHVFIYPAHLIKRLQARLVIEACMLRKGRP